MLKQGTIPCNVDASQLHGPTKAFTHFKGTGISAQSAMTLRILKENIATVSYFGQRRA